MCIRSGASALRFVIASNNRASTPKWGQAQKARLDFVWLQVNILPEVSQLKTEKMNRICLKTSKEDDYCGQSFHNDKITA